MNEGTELQLFDVNGSDWRFGTTEDGRPYVVATDVAKSFGYRDAEKAMRLLDDDEKGTQIVGTPSGQQVLGVIYEDGLWELIFLSRKPEAKALKKRVKEILRQIRETGSYSVVQKPVSALDALEGMVTALRQQEQRTAVLEAKVEAIEGRHDWFAALGFAKLHGLPTENSYLIRVGLKASSLMRKDGLKPVKRQNAMYGEVNTYPVAYLEQAFAEVKA